MVWSIRNDLPIYSQLVEQVKLAIVSGVFSPGERLVSVRDMATEAGVNPNTMQRALQELEREEMVFSQRTSGRFVTEDRTVIENVKKNIAGEQVKSFLESMKKLGYSKDEIISLLSVEEEEKDEGNT